MTKSKREHSLNRERHAARPGCDFGSAQAAQAAGKKCSIILGLESPSHNSYATGPAFPCRCAPGDNLALHRALKSASRGAVIVCDAGGRLDVGYFGELMVRIPMKVGSDSDLIPVTDSDAMSVMGRSAATLAFLSCLK